MALAGKYITAGAHYADHLPLSDGAPERLRLSLESILLLLHFYSKDIAVFDCYKWLINKV